MPGGALRPSEVDFLAKIVKRHCEVFGIRSEEGRDHVAASALVHFQRGVEEEEELLAILAAEDDPSRLYSERL